MKRYMSWMLIFLCLCLCPAGCVPPQTGASTQAGTPVRTAQTAPQTKAPEGILRCHFLDVGQGDAAFLELPDGKTMLIDASTSEQGSKIVHYIQGLGYRKLDYVVATHPHADHIGGMAEVLQKLEVGAFYMPKKEHTSKTFERMLDQIETKEIPLYTAKAGVTLPETDKVQAEFLGPVLNSYKDLNNYSAVLRLSYGESVFLFMGDAEAEAEAELPRAKLRAQVLKVGHHGSHSSSGESFLQAVSPQYAVISCGRGNSYGHPHQETLDSLTRLGCTIFRTDEQGTIVCDADARGITSCQVGNRSAN